MNLVGEAQFGGPRPDLGEVVGLVTGGDERDDEAVAIAKDRQGFEEGEVILVGPGLGGVEGEGFGQVELRTGGGEPPRQRGVLRERERPGPRAGADDPGSGSGGVDVQPGISRRQDGERHGDHQ